ncbi:hypothetical protein GF359_07995 [candidate division WOR-3 bacterium]|uniref:HEAT repeat domain-containing protein n=1 Tax=candidate division WOR-3 bacterium TaxID=2052148 RepID=A0A9D5QDI8_UNCW3|nr:hypothetical protein [candidate division WOR-3 bacterium]MBD3365142.1 hypothetical protein [candidate division WOR-3 bacterium]
MLMVLAEVDEERAREIAAGYLKSEDVRKKRTAAANLGRIDDSAYIPYLVNLLDDKDKETACYAAYSLGFLGDTSGAQLLREAAYDTQTNDDYNSRVLFDKLPAALIEPVIYPFLTTDFGQPTRTSIEAVGILADTPAVPYLIGFLKDTDTAMQRLALEALGRIDAPSTSEYVYPFLESDYYQLKEAAIKALGRMGDTSAVERLNLMLFWEPSAEGLMIRHTIMEALAMTGSRKALPALAATLDNADPYLALKILDYLTRAADTAYVPYVEPFLADTLAPLRIRAAAAVLALSGNN